MFCVAQLPADVLKEQLGNGLILLGLGMCIVFVFLFILVIVVKLVSAVINGGSKKKATVAAPVAQPAPVKAAPVATSVAKPVASAPVSASVAKPVATAGGTVKAPMPGLILKINVKEGDYVAKNQLVMVMEAMKMENEIYAPYEGVVTKIVASLGNQVNADDPLLEIGASAQTTTVEVASEPVAKSVAPTAKPVVEPVATPKAPAKPFVVPTRRTTSTAPAPARAQKVAPSPRTTARPVAVNHSATSGAEGASSGTQIVEAPMPGLVLRFCVNEGDKVEKNQLILVLEAMKMENEVYAPKSGTLTKFFVSAGAQLESGDKMFEIQ